MSAWRRDALLALAAVGLAFALGLLAVALVLDPTRQDFAVSALSFGGSGLAGAGAALLVRSRADRMSLAVQLAVATGIGFGALVLNVTVAAALMFLSGHDLRLLLILLGFAFLAAGGPMLLMLRGVTERVGRLERAAGRMAEGDLATRIATSGSDEIAHLEVAFNEMASALEVSEMRRDALEQARRDLFAAISHDLRTPLSSIRVMVDAMEDGVVDDEPTRDRYIRTIGAEAGRLASLIDDLFELAMIDAGQLPLRPELLRVEDLIDEAMQLVQAHAERAGVALSFRREGPLPPVQADAQRLSRVLRNLIQNSLRHTLAPGEIVVSAIADDLGVTVAVADSGEGIASEDAPFVFDRFYRGEKSRSRDSGGSGLGLSIARGIVEAHGGRIWVEPGRPDGATVAFSLPLVATVA